MLYHKLMKIVFLIIAIIFPLISLAQVEFQNPIEHDSFEDLFQAVTRFIFWLIVAIVPIVILVAAFQLFGAGDDPKKVENAKNIIKWTIIGFGVMLAATALFNLIKNIVTDELDEVSIENIYKGRES